MNGFVFKEINTERRKYYKDKRGKEYYKYSFEKEQCRNCPLRESCVKEKRIGKMLVISINTPEFYGYNQEQKTEEFKEKYRKRACQEWKNGEMKNFHGLDRARGYGLKSMVLQAKLTALAVNLKRIASLLSSQISFLSVIFSIFYKYQLKSGIITRITLKKGDFFSGLEPSLCFF